MPDALSRLQRIAAAAMAHAEAEREAERARLEERAATGDERSIRAMARFKEHEERRRQFQEQFQRRFQEGIERGRSNAHQRRGRLQPGDVVAAALNLLDAKGLDGITLRDVAAQVHVQAPALYWHFANKRDLVDAMAQQILVDFVGALEQPENAAAWRPWMRQSAHGLRAAMLARRDGGRVVAGAALGRARALAGLIAMSLRVLEAAGFDAVTASAGTRTMIGYTFGAVIEEQSGPDFDEDSAEMQALERDFPDISAAIDAQLQLSPTAQFDMGLELILRGLESRR